MPTELNYKIITHLHEHLWENLSRLTFSDNTVKMSVSSESSPLQSWIDDTNVNKRRIVRLESKLSGHLVPYKAIN